jgi:zinc transport system ATP-binding protein
MTSSLVHLSNATIGYDDAVVLSDIDVTINRGDFTAIVGPNGAGKSTLVKAILGLVSLTSGTLELFGVPPRDFADRWRIGYVPQRQTVGGPIPATVREVVASGRLTRRGVLRWPTSADRAAVDAAMQRVGIDQLARRPVHRLSGGQQRRVLIARALAGDADLLLLDEPTAGIDVESQAALVDVLGELRAAGVTVAVVTHDLQPFADHLTRVLWVSRGQISYDGEPTADIVAAASEPFAHHDHSAETPRDSMPDDLRTGR